MADTTAPPGSARPADLVLLDGEVLTVDGAFSTAQAVAVRDGLVLAVGSTAEVLAHAGPATRTVDLRGRTLLPGINDSHLHGHAWGLNRPPLALDLNHPAVGSIADVVATVAAAARTAAPGEWIVGRGWDVGYLAECLDGSRGLPDRADLDAAAPDNPVCLTDFSDHTAWVNSAALRVAGIGRGSVPPPGGTIDTDPAGNPTGILREAAQRAVHAHIPRPDEQRRRAAVTGAIRALNALGTTSYTEPGLGPGGEGIMAGALGGAALRTYLDLARADELHARVSVLLLPAPMGGGVADLEAGLADLAGTTLDGIDPRRLAVLGVKLFADGVPPNRTAWMRDAYPGGGHGALCVHGSAPALQAAELTAMIAVAHAAGHQIGVHVTGDLAIDTVADALAAAQLAHPRPDARHYLIHGDFATPRALDLLARHDYGVNMNPAIKWTISDLMDEVVGPDRSARMWPVRSALDAGVRVCASSDAPITEPDWRRGVAAMLLRESKATGRTSGPRERVGLRDAVRAYTAEPARQDFAERWKGSIEPGKVADLCVLGGRLTTTSPHDLPGLPVDLTLLDGRRVHGED
ncbi:amidohydrolase [Streptomyces sp. CBMA156]|uniref:amidohydrolase n=1 Tax=Streptomyces sp. CBMA156 TaxID=1930280 RepID=UPI001661BD7E|nr:amidohydrolase [Streptomyces sp. CBMA156]MBD0670415.1 amidohydrolase [Streptomyces sp. CBMA156]MBD0671091.1 amidohydrolase [Streptomyces sp. CBMA156]